MRVALAFAIGNGLAGGERKAMGPKERARVNSKRREGNINIPREFGRVLEFTSRKRDNICQWFNRYHQSIIHLSMFHNR